MRVVVVPQGEWSQVEVGEWCRFLQRCAVAWLLLCSHSSRPCNQQIARTSRETGFEMRRVVVGEGTMRLIVD